MASTGNKGYPAICLQIETKKHHKFLTALPHLISFFLHTFALFSANLISVTHAQDISTHRFRLHKGHQMAAQGGKLWNNTVPRDLRHGTTLFVSTFWETSLPAIAQACLLLLFFSKDILIDVYLAVLLFTKRVAHFIHWQHCIPWHEQGVFFSSNHWIFLRIFEFLLVQTKKKSFSIKKTDVFRFF